MNTFSGNWPNRDLFGEDGGGNLYAFVENRPTGEIDLFGLCKQLTESVNLPSHEIDIPLGLFVELDGSISLQASLIGRKCDCCSGSTGVKSEGTFVISGSAEAGITFGKRINRSLGFINLMGFAGLRVAGDGGIEGRGTFRVLCDGSREAEGAANLTASLIGQGGLMLQGAFPKGWPLRITGPPWGERFGIGLMMEGDGTFSSGINILCKDGTCKMSAQANVDLTVDAKGQLRKWSVGWQLYQHNFSSQQLDLGQFSNPFDLN